MAREMTITLDDDVAAKLEAEAQRTGTAPEEIVNTTLRQGLDPEVVSTPRKPFKIRTHDFGFSPELDFECTGRLMEQLDRLEREEKQKGR